MQDDEEEWKEKYRKIYLTVMSFFYDNFEFIGKDVDQNLLLSNVLMMISVKLRMFNDLTPDTLPFFLMKLKKLFIQHIQILSV